jgi:acyl carrier protein
MGRPTAISTEGVREAIRSFIVENFLFGEDRRIPDDESFLQSGLIDSTGILELVQFIEQTYGITVEDPEMVPENLGSLAGIVAFVTAKTAR